ncbi:hypothetical protein AB0M10_15265 [Streptomyces sp. NPDC051840]|uniref:hypothetical protein n=1 Tax=Streptomyces sp. NPDC051840 TaxID=3154752 RepID=UPI003443EE00
MSVSLRKLRQRRDSLTDGFYVRAVADVHDTRRMVRTAIGDEMRRMEASRG